MTHCLVGWFIDSTSTWDSSSRLGQSILIFFSYWIFQMWAHPCAHVIFDTDPTPRGRGGPAEEEEMSQALIRSVDTYTQAFSQDLKSGRPKYVIGPAKMKNSKGNIWKTKQFSSVRGPPQDTWTPIWPKACLHCNSLLSQKLLNDFHTAMLY